MNSSYTKEQVSELANEVAIRASFRNEFDLVILFSSTIKRKRSIREAAIF